MFPFASEKVSEKEKVMKVNFCYSLTELSSLYDITNSWGTWAIKKNPQRNKNPAPTSPTKKNPRMYGTASLKAGNQKGLVNT